MDVTQFLGTWVNQENEYEFGQPPADASYTISQLSSDELQFDMSWLDANNQRQLMSYTSVLDGQKHPYEPQEIADQVQTTLITANRMETRSYKNGHEVAFASRAVQANGQHMEVIQQITQADGTVLTNKSLYYKKA